MPEEREYTVADLPLVDFIEPDERVYEAADLQKIDFIETVLWRPRMFTWGGTFDEVMAFMEGYHFAFYHLKSNPSEDADWKAFEKWYVLKTYGPGNNGWSYAPLKAQFGTDAEALVEILRLYREFRSERETANPTQTG